MITYTEVNTDLVIAKTVFVSKNGNDATGLCERLDKPFLTIQAATTAALAFFPIRTQSDRVKIVVESGNYVDQISVEDFIDYDLGNSVIDGANSGVPTIYAPDTTVYTATTEGIPNCIIYGNATIRNSFANTAVVEIRSQCTVLLSCNILRGEFFEAILMRTGNLNVYANIIHSAITNDTLRQVINLATNNAYLTAPILQVNGAKIYNAYVNAINSVIEIYNGLFGSTLTLNRSKLMLVNCQVGNYSTTRAAIDTPNIGAPSRGYGDISLVNSIIYCNDILQNCINDNFATGDKGDLTVYNYDLYANTNYSLTNPASQFLVNGPIINVAVNFNNNVPI